MFLERRILCDLFQWNPLTKKRFFHSICMTAYLCSPFSGFPPPISSVSVLSAHLCLCGTSYLCSGHIPFASSSGHTSSLCTVRVSSLTVLWVCVSSCIGLLPTSYGRLPHFHRYLVDSYVSLLLLANDWPCSSFSCFPQSLLYVCFILAWLN